MAQKRIYGCLIHLEIIDGKIWVQRDDTEDGVSRLALKIVIRGDRQ